jgi:membrane-bound lytic murein transglycosylase MltF
MNQLRKRKIWFFLILGLFATPSIIHSCGPRTREQAGQGVALAVDSLSVNVQWSEESEMLGLGVAQWGDLDSLVKRRVIRALVPYSKTYYHIDGKGRSGMSYDALNAFEQYLNRQLGFNPPRVRVVFIPVNHDQLIEFLHKGYGDLALGGITVLEERKQFVDFSIPTRTGMNQVVVGGPSSYPLQSLLDLSGKPVFVYGRGSYAQALDQLNDSLEQIMLPPVQIHAADEYLSEEDILELVNAGHLPYTIVEEDLALHWASQSDSLRVYDNLVVRRNSSYACAVRKDAPRLRAMIDKFLKTHRKGTEFGNILFNKYLGVNKHAPRLHPKVSEATLRKVEGHFREYGERYRLDWLLLMAQGYQESRLDNTAKSSAGAVGIMQVKPSTAAGDPINIRNVYALENNIHAGAKYDRHLMDHYFQSESMDELNRHLFALAAYNAGPARIAHLRKVAEARKVNPNIWFGHVEKVVAHEVGRETVQYVSNIYKYYISFSALRSYERNRGQSVWRIPTTP